MVGKLPPNKMVVRSEEVIISTREEVIISTHKHLLGL